MRSHRIKHFLQSLQFAFLLAAVTALPAAAAADAPGTWSIVVGSASGVAGEVVEIPIVLHTGSTRIGAIAFSVDYDDTKLILAGDPAAGSKVEIPAPAHFTASSWLSNAGPSIGIAVYDRERPIEALPQGTLATLRFRVLPDAAGFASVSVRPSTLSASSPDGTLLTGASIVSGGVGLHTAFPRLHLSPSTVHFGPVRIGSVETRTVVVANPGSGSLTLGGVRIEGSDAFALSGGVPSVIASGSSAAIRISFAPLTRGETSARLVVQSQQAGEASVELLGAGSAGELYFDRQLIVPAVASLRSGDGSRWASSLQMYNSGTSPAAARVRLLRAGSTSVEEREVTLATGESLGWDDVVSELFEIDEDVSGILRIHATSDALVFRSATYKELPNGGRIAQSVPVIAREELFRPGEEARLIGLARSEHRRTNVTVMNLGAEKASLKVELRDASGSLLNTLLLTLDSGQIAPVLPILDGLSSDIEDLVVLVSSDSPGAEFFVYSSTVDQRTGAPLFQSPR